jgi:predicted metallopeptidase
MGIKYNEAQDIKEKVRRIVEIMDLDYVNINRVFFIRSHESSSRNIIARCHALPKILQQVLEIEPAYVIEILSEKFDKMSEEDQVKTLIHELLHIPKSFGGGFRHHDFVQRRTIDKFYKMYLEKEKKHKFDEIKKAGINERLRLLEESSDDNSETRQSRLEF